MSLEPPGKLQKLRAALHAKAKASPKQRFHALYDKVYRLDVLGHAYVCCKAHGGAAGVDDQTFADIETYGRERWLGEPAARCRTHEPSPRAGCGKSAGKASLLFVRFDERDVETEHGLAIEAPPDERGGNR